MSRASMRNGSALGPRFCGASAARSAASRWPRQVLRVQALAAHPCADLAGQGARLGGQQDAALVGVGDVAPPVGHGQLPAQGLTVAKPASARGSGAWEAARIFG